MKIENGVLLDVTNADVIEGEFIFPKGITSISNWAFSGCSSLTEIILPEGITSIGNYAFRGCSSLTEIILPEGITSIGNYAFRGCSSLASINLPEGITSIGNLAFDDCSSLTSISLPEGITSIGNYAFIGCSSLTSINLSESITSIGNWAFSGCSSLTEIRLPKGITYIGNYAFRGCSSLVSKEGKYKAFDKGLKCNNMQYIPYEWNNIEGEIIPCKWGLHFVTNLFDLFNYYSGDLENDIEIWEVETGDIVVSHEDDSKKATNAIKPKRKLTILDIINILNNK